MIPVAPIMRKKLEMMFIVTSEVSFIFLTISTKIMFENIRTPERMKRAERPNNCLECFFFIFLDKEPFIKLPEVRQKPAIVNDENSKKL